MKGPDTRETSKGQGDHRQWAGQEGGGPGLPCSSPASTAWGFRWVTPFDLLECFVTVTCKYISSVLLFDRLKELS